MFPLNRTWKVDSNHIRLEKKLFKTSVFLNEKNITDECTSNSSNEYQYIIADGPTFTLGKKFFTAKLKIGETEYHAELSNIERLCTKCNKSSNANETVCSACEEPLPKVDELIGSHYIKYAKNLHLILLVLLFLNSLLAPILSLMPQNNAEQASPEVALKLILTGLIPFLCLCLLTYFFNKKRIVLYSINISFIAGTTLFSFISDPTSSSTGLFVNMFFAFMFYKAIMSLKTMPANV